MKPATMSFFSRWHGGTWSTALEMKNDMSILAQNYRTGYVAYKSDNLRDFLHILVFVIILIFVLHFYIPRKGPWNIFTLYLGDTK